MLTFSEHFTMLCCVLLRLTVWKEEKVKQIKGRQFHTLFLKVRKGCLLGQIVPTELKSIIISLISEPLAEQTT